jgi:hypothetical protein
MWPVAFANSWLVRRDSRRRVRSPFVHHKPRVELLEERTVLSSLRTKLPVLPTHPIQSTLVDSSSFVPGLYFSLLQRQPSAAEVSIWANMLDQGATTTTQVAQAFVASNEFRSDEILNDYHTILGREPEAGAINNWLNIMNQGVGAPGAQQVLVDFLASPEYFRKNGSTAAGWLTGVYRDLLGRTPDSGGFSSWLAAMQHGASLNTVATGFVYSPEEDARLITSAYQKTLGRAPEPGGLQFWVGALQNQVAIEQVYVLVATSKEFVNLQEGVTLPVIGANASSPRGQSSIVGPMQMPSSSGTSGSPMLLRSAGTSSPASATPSFAVRAPVDVNHEIGNQSEESIAVDPNNPLNLFVASNENDLITGMMGAFSNDGGLTWHPRLVGDGSDGIPVTFSDPWTAWDSFGNLFFSYIAAQAPGVIGSNLNMAIVVSTNGGRTFREVGSFPVFDHPEIAVGAGEVFVTVALTNTSPVTPSGFDIGVSGARVTGLGKIGTFTTPVHIPGSDGMNFGDVAIGPSGQVLVTMQTDSGRGAGAGPSNILFSQNLAPFSGGTWSNARFDALETNVGGFRAILPQADRTVPAGLELAYDNSNGPHRGRVYLGYLDAMDTATMDTDVFVRFSDDNGLSWSSPVRVNDDPGNHSQFFDKLAVDQSTGVLGVAWYDARQDFTDQVVNVFATVSLDGGNSFMPNVQVSASPSNALGLPGNGANDFGDYMGLAFANNQMYPAWADNSAFLSGVNPGPSLPPPLPKALDIAVAVVALNGVTPIGGSGSGTGSGDPSGGSAIPDDQFEPNDSSNRATQFGALVGSEAFSNLTINTHSNGLPDTDWYQWSAGQSGTFTASINYNTPDGGDLNMRVFTLSSQGVLIQLGSSLVQHSASQTVSVGVTAGEPLFVWVYGFDNAYGTYGLNVNLS